MAASFTFRSMVRTYLQENRRSDLFFDAPAQFAVVAVLGFVVAWWFLRGALLLWAVENAGNAVLVSVAILGILLASLAVVATFGDERYVRFLHDAGVYNTVMLQFSWYSAVATVSVGLNLLLTLGKYVPGTGQVAWVPAGLAVGALAWSVGGAWLCTRTLVRYAMLRGRFVATRRDG